MDRVEIELESIRLRHHRRITFLQAAVAIALGIFALAVAREPVELPLGLPPIPTGISLLLIAIYFYDKKLSEDENAVINLKRKK